MKLHDEYLACALELYSHGRLPETLSQERIQGVKAFFETVPPSVWQNPAESDAALAKLPDPQRTNLQETLGQIRHPNRPWDRYLAPSRDAWARTLAFFATHLAAA